MENNRQLGLPEIVFGTSDSKLSHAIRRRVKDGQLRKIMPRVYSANLQDSPEQIVRRNLFIILGKLFPGAVVSYRTAFEVQPTTEGAVFLTYKYTKKINIPGISVCLLKGVGPLQGDTPFIGDLYMASRARAFLENMRSSRTSGRTSVSVRKTLSQEELEVQLDKLCRVQGQAALQQLRDEARGLADQMQESQSFKKLDQLIGAVLGTRDARSLRTPAAKARALGKAFDPDRLSIFQTLYAALQQTAVANRLFNVSSIAVIRHLAFFEAYFSNYIEGTEFEIEEAYSIVMEGQPCIMRSADAHDITGTFNIVSNLQNMSQRPESVDDLIMLLKTRHAVLMAGRPEKQPGQFKADINRAGDTVFVESELIIGTLEKSFEIYRAISEPLARAIFMMFMVSEVHPFNDGNGRIARIMMNAELAAENHCRIIIPTVYREDYLLALRALSRQHYPTPYIRMLDFAQAFTSALNFTDYEKALDTLEKCQAFHEPSSGRLVMPNTGTG